jgi:hypothetical protein
MNRAQQYNLLVARLHRFLQPHQVKHIARDIRDLAQFTPDELREIGIEEPPSKAFVDALPVRRSIYSPRK